MNGSSKKTKQVAGDDAVERKKATGTAVGLFALGLVVLAIGGCEQVVGWSIPTYRHPAGRVVGSNDIWISVVLAACFFVAAGIAKIYQALRK